MGKHTNTATQTRYPWRATIRTMFASLVGLLVMAEPIYEAITRQEAGQATGWAAGALAVSGAVTRLLALPEVDGWLHRWLPWLATGEQTDEQFSN